MKPTIRVFAAVFVLCLSAAMLSCNCLCSAKQATSAKAPPPPHKPADIDPSKPWSFVVSGDSRNCGDVIMPAIAIGADQNHAQFYWHLGDLRATYEFDEDIAKAAERDGKKLRISDYLGTEDGKNIGEWDDFKQFQIVPFGDIPFFLGIGNHETIWPQNRDRFSKYFPQSLDRKELKEQRLKDLQKHSPGKNAQDTGAKTYYHWTMSNVDFIYLDNATKDQFDAAQVQWVESVLKDDADPKSSIRTVVVGMHEALPNSISADHSMNESSPEGEKSGEQIYQDLLNLQKAGKKVYVLASHSHFFMDGIFKTPYWYNNGGELPGWIIGTAGAVRYRLPAEANLANAAKTDVYGYLLATVSPDGSIEFKFQELKERDIPKYVVDRYPEKFVNWCFMENRRLQ
jgi:hypothetical protein